MSGRALNVLVGLAAAVVVVAGLKAASSVLIPIVVAALLALIVYPIASWLRSRGMPVGLAVLSAILTALAVSAGPVAVVVTAARQFAARVPEYREALGRSSAEFSTWVARYGVTVEQPLADPGIMFDWMTAAATGTASLLTKLFFVLLIAAFAMLEAAEFRPKLQSAFHLKESDVARLLSGTRHVHEFLWLKTIVSGATGLVVWLWTELMGIEFALLWGLAAFVLNYIPNFGSFLAAVPPSLIALISGGPGRALVVALGFVVINIALGSVVEPRLIGRRLGLSPLALVVSLVFWGWVWGPVGLLLAVPVTMAVRLVLEEFDQTRWVAVLIARAPQPPPGPRARTPKQP